MFTMGMKKWVPFWRILRLIEFIIKDINISIKNNLFLETIIQRKNKIILLNNYLLFKIKFYNIKYLNFFNQFINDPSIYIFKNFNSYGLSEKLCLIYKKNYIYSFKTNEFVIKYFIKDNNLLLIFGLGFDKYYKFPHYLYNFIGYYKYIKNIRNFIYNKICYNSCITNELNRVKLFFNLFYKNKLNKTICICSGDSQFYSIIDLIIQFFGIKNISDKFSSISNISSFQYFSTFLGSFISNPISILSLSSLLSNWKKIKYIILHDIRNGSTGINFNPKGNYRKKSLIYILNFIINKNIFNILSIGKNLDLKSIKFDNYSIFKLNVNCINMSSIFLYYNSWINILKNYKNKMIFYSLK